MGLTQSGVLGAALAALALSLGGTPALADSHDTAGATGWNGAFSGNLEQLSDEELERRTDFIIERLEDGKQYAQIWQYGFTSGYGFGIAFGIAQAVDQKSSRDEEIANGAVTAVKATFGVARLLLAPNPGRHGARAVEAIDRGTREGRLARLREAESVLEAVERRAESRWDWKRHAGNFAVNGIGAGIIAGFGGNTEALSNGLVGVTVGTIMAFSMPWRGVQDAEDYRSFMRADNVPDDPEVSWSFYPTGSGVGMRVDF